MGSDQPRSDSVTDVTRRHGWDVLISTLDENTVEYTLEVSSDGTR